jgi:hypothetical protein
METRKFRGKPSAPVKLANTSSPDLGISQTYAEIYFLVRHVKYPGYTRE